MGYLNTFSTLEELKAEMDYGTQKLEQMIKPLEKEIVIELSLLKREWKQTALLEHAVKTFGAKNDPENIFKISIEKLKETRTIRTKGKMLMTLK